MVVIFTLTLKIIVLSAALVLRALALMVIVLHALPLIVIIFSTVALDVLRSVFISRPSDTCGFSIAILVNISVSPVVVDTIVEGGRRKDTLMCSLNWGLR